VNLIKYVNEKFDDLLDTPKTSETQEITADDSALIQISTKIPKLLSVRQVEEKEALTHKVKVKGRHGETSQFAFSNKGNMSETENSTTSFFKWDCTHYSTEIF
jgi:hypothetical protein